MVIPARWDTNEVSSTIGSAYWLERMPRLPCKKGLQRKRLADSLGRENSTGNPERPRWQESRERAPVRRQLLREWTPWNYWGFASRYRQALIGARMWEDHPWLRGKKPAEIYRQSSPSCSPRTRNTDCYHQPE